jgi:hypothetical protein
LELLEERLPPGDAWVSVLGGLADADLGLANLGSDPYAAESARFRLTDRADDPAEPLGITVGTRSVRPSAVALDRSAPPGNSGAADLANAPAMGTTAGAGAVRSSLSAADRSAFPGLAVGVPAGRTGAEPGAASPRVRPTAAARMAATPARSGGTGAAHSAQWAYGQLPLSFERNLGQTASRVDYLARAGNATVFLTPTAAVFAMQERSAVSGQQSAGLPGTPPEVRSTNAGVALYMDLVGANPAARPAGQEPLPGKVNYFIGNDPAKWHSNIPTYGRVEYPYIYPGISLAYYGGPGGLEYDFVLSPGADAHAIALDFRGADGVGLNAQGDLVVHTAAGDVVQHAPVIFQESSGQRQPVAGRFVLDSGVVRFEVGTYDHTRPLVIDPLVMGYSTFLGGSAQDAGLGLAADGKGAAYVTGITDSINFPTTPGAYDTALDVSPDAFVVKLNAAGSAPVYGTYLGGSGFDEGYGLAVDGAGSAYVAGYTNSANFPTTTHFGPSGGAAFVTKLTPTGAGLVYSAVVGGGYAAAISLDSAANAYLTGAAASTFPTTPGAFDTTPNGGSDVFVTKLNAAGSVLAYSTFLGGVRNDYGYGIAVDAAHNVYVTGQTESHDFPTMPGGFQRGFAGGPTDAFVVKLNAAGSALVYANFLGGTWDDGGAAIAVDSAGYAYVTGSTSSTDFPSTVHFGNGYFGPYETKVNPSGTELVYSATFAGGGDGTAIALDGAGNAYMTGDTSFDFPTTSDAFDGSFNGDYDAFLTKLNAAGSALIYSTYLGGSNYEIGSGIAVDASGNVYLAGDTDSANFPTTPGAFKQRNRNGIADAFLTRFENV